LVLNGDTLCFADIRRAGRHLEFPEIAGVLLAREVEDAARYGSLTLDAQGCLAGFTEKRPGRGLVNAGVYLFRAGLLEEFPAQTPLSLEREVFPALTARGRLLKVETMQAPFLDIGTPETLPLAADFVRRHRDEFELA
ncbi:MAG: sugar phosphate nucleotidyltransferase, partial [Verrucomicrobiae bacterium]|nr:sugar phosphate nucleotidyltransferase [Verrucomicrobiae bacterium]